MLNINEEDLKAAIVEKATDEILRDDGISGLIAVEVKKRIDKIFADCAQAQIEEAINQAIREGFTREYQRVNSFGSVEGERTTIQKQLEKIVGGYWNASVNPRSGSPDSSGYGAVTRAEFLMTQICAKDFTEGLKQSALNITGALKDGLRLQLGAQMDTMLNGLFHVKSLQDQGKVEKPY